MSPRVAVCHPAKQHSHRLATGLYRDGMLAIYITGSPTTQKHFRFIPGFAATKKIRLAEKIPLEKVLWLPIAPIFYFLMRLFSKYQFSHWFTYLGDWLADYVYSLILPWDQIDAVVGYENACYRIFKKAKSKGKATVLDAASLHYASQDKLVSFRESARLHWLVIKRKDREISLANFVLTCSEIAKLSYVEVGLLPRNTASVPLGVDVEQFQFAAEVAEKNYVFKFICVASISKLKGIDILLKAFSMTLNSYPLIQLELVGDMGDAGKNIAQFSNHQNLILKRRLSAEELSCEYQGADCFILPSRFDSYGMVVVEAMACGLPVIVSDQVGGKDLVEEDKNGWVIPSENVEALADRMKWCVERRDVLQSMRPFCRETAEKNSWEHYYDRVSSCISNILGFKSN